MVSRYTASTLASLALAAGALGAAGPARAETISVVSFGGAYENAMKESFFKPYAAKNSGVDFSYESYDGGLAKLSAMVQAKNTTWDLMDMEEQDMIAACDEGLLQSFDKGLLGDASDFLPGTIAKCGVATAMWTSIFAYDTTKLATEPTTIADFFDTRKFPGKRGMRKTATLTLEAALLADGVPAADVYKVLGTPQGLERAFSKLDSIKGDIVWWEAGSQPPQLLADGAVTMTLAYNGRIDTAIKQDSKPFKIVWDGQVYMYEWMGVPAGAKHGDEAKKILAFASQPEQLAAFTQFLPYAPPRMKALPLVAKDRLSDLPTAPENFRHALKFDSEFWVDHGDEISKRFMTWLSK